MGLTREQAERCGLGHLFPDPAPAVKGDAGPAAKKKPGVKNELGQNKYGAKPTVYAGVRYASKAEASRAALLDRNVADGHTLFWVGQPKFRLGLPENVYRADFLVVTHGGVHVEEIKGHETPKFRRDRKLWQAYGPCDLWIIKGDRIEVVSPPASRNRGDDDEIRDKI